MKCEIEGCDNNVMLSAYGKFMCADCFLKIQDKINKQYLELLK